MLNVYLLHLAHLQDSATDLTLKVLIATIDAQWEGMGDVGSVRYKPALLPPCPTIRVLSYSKLVNFQKFSTLRVNL